MRAELARRQRDMGMTDQAFAAMLGIPRSTWTLIRLGQFPINRQTVQGALNTFPDLADAAMDWLRGNGEEVSM